VARGPRARAKADKWTRAKAECVATAGWGVVARLAGTSPDLPDDYFAGHLAVIERDIHAAPNRVRHAMNNALIAVGCRNDALKALALAATARVGKVEVDHGETSCQTPDAAAYIAKVHARKKR
jgi:hypothetical protein